MIEIVKKNYQQDINLYLKWVLNSVDVHILVVDHSQKNKERIQKFKETRDSRYIIKMNQVKLIFKMQRQPPEVIYKKRCSQTFRNAHRKTPVPESLFFIKLQASDLRPATVLKKRLWRRCFPVNFKKFLRTPFSQNTSGRLLLKMTWLMEILKI